MDFDLNDEQRELRDAARRFLEKEAPISYARAMMDDARGYRADLWRQMADLGWMALGIDEAHGGLGLGTIAQTILLIEMGRVVLPGPFLSSAVLAATAIAEAGSDAQRVTLLPKIASGELIGSFAHDGHVEARDHGLFGESRFVSDGHIAASVVVVAHLGDGSPALFVAEPDARADVTTMDMTRKTAHLRFDGARGERLERSGAEVLARIYDRAALAVAAEMLGAADRVLELSVEYAKAREQFGRPIGSFQAVKHRLADMLVDLESLRNAVSYAAWALDRNVSDASLAASIAKAFASDAAVRIAKSGVQVHGGIGFTWEHDMHLFLKRLKADEHLFGDATAHRERIARLLASTAARG